jgi:hypothetical protein
LVNQYAASAYNAANTNNSAIIAVNQYAMSAYYNGNLNATNINHVNEYAVSAFNTANSASANTIYHSGVNITQNTNIIYATAIAGYGWDTANIAIQRLDNGTGVQATQNTRIDGLEGANLTQNTRIDSIETINTNQNTSISIIQGVNDTQNTRLNIIEGTNLTQNTRLDGIEGVNLSQNTTITEVNQFVASAYNKANNALPLTGGTITGSLLVGQDINVTGNLYIGGNTTTVSTNNITLNDSLIYLADANPANTVDIGLVGHFVQGKYQHTGVVRNHLNGNWTFFSNVSTEPTTTINFAEANIIYDSITTGGIITPSATINGKDWQSVNDSQNTSITVIEGTNLTQNTRLDGIEGVNVTQNTNITSVNQFTQSAYNTANTKLSLSGGTVAGDVTANNFTANLAIRTPVLYSTGGTASIEMSDIGIIGINPSGGSGAGIKLVGKNVEGNKFYGGSYGGNYLSVENETKLVSNRYDVVKISTGTDGNEQNSWNFSNNHLIFPDGTYQNTAYNGVSSDSYARDTANGANGLAQGAFNKANNALANTTGTFAGSLTTTGNVRVTSTQISTSTTTGALTVSGGVGISGNLYAGNIYTNGALINNSAALTVYKYVATAGQTTFSGTDVNSLTLSYVASAIFVTLNGVVLNNTLEYTATNGTSVVLGTAAELDNTDL